VIEQFRHVTLRCHGNGRCPGQSLVVRRFVTRISAVSCVASNVRQQWIRRLWSAMLWNLWRQAFSARTGQPYMSQQNTSWEMKTSGQSNLTISRIAAAHGWFSGIRQVAPVSTLPNTCFIRPTWVHIPNGISIGSAVFTGLTTVTDHATRSVAIARPHLRMLHCDAA